MYVCRREKLCLPERSLEINVLKSMRERERERERETGILNSRTQWAGMKIWRRNRHMFESMIEKRCFCERIATKECARMRARVCVCVCV